MTPVKTCSIADCGRPHYAHGLCMLDPFAGIGSTPYTAVRQGRFGIGIELKASYFAVAARNMAEASATKDDLFAFAGMRV